MTSEANGPFAPPMNALAMPPAPSLLSPTQFAAQPPSTLPSALKITSIPADLTPREAALMFALVCDDVAAVDVHDGAVTAQFHSAASCMATRRLLDGKHVFGAAAAPVKVDFEPAGAVAAATASLDSMRLSSAGISPPSHLQLSQHPQHAPDAFLKRKSVGNQRSRFLFSDPFLGAATPTPAASIDLSDLSGKSLLMMESQSDARDYDALVRDPWAALQGPFASNPQTPGLSVHSSFDWSAQGAPAPAPLAGPPSAPPSALADRRRTLSAFFNGSATSGAPQQPQTVAAILSQGPTMNGSGMNGGLAPLLIPAGSSRNGPTSAGSIPSGNMSAGNMSGNMSSGNMSSSKISPSSASGSLPPASATTPTSQPRVPSKDVPDLSLLARVPPPANPADQNPPCNTLYVGNLPPDATEAELRSLFAPQKGFRRLSFRTKNQSLGGGSSSSSHNHGPMCFVEFEDVAHATIALAELYGRALPRPNGSNGKGGIRLLFSKNPLGVRGPGNPRRTPTNQQGATSNGSSNGVGNYGYLNYHG